MRAIPERLRDASCGGAIQIDHIYLYLLYIFFASGEISHLVIKRRFKVFTYFSGVWVDLRTG